MYDLRVEGALYFPHIQVPMSPWFTRSLLYWDEVGTIVPQGWVEEPEELGEHTLELVRRGLVRQVFPEEAAFGLSSEFQRWLDGLSRGELEQRRARLEAGETTRVHVDKWLTYVGGVRHVMNEGLAERPLQRDWLEVEPQTANEFMAALALGLCHPDGGLSRGSGCAWIPATDDPAAFQVLLTGLEKAVPASPAERDVQLRLRGELQVCEVRTSLLERALPVPTEPVSAERIERFRRKHGDRLPRCRRQIEALIDGTLDLDEVRRLRAVGRVAEEVAELAGEAEAYLREAGIRRITRSPLVRMLKVAPLLAGPVSGALETAQALETAESLNSEALAYLALARVELGLDAKYSVRGNAPFVEVFGP
jgi:hypothetical protein